MRHSVLFLVLLGACAKPMPAPPAPVSLASPVPPVTALQRAAQHLTAAGFTISTSDATTGILTATQERDAARMAPDIACYYGPDAIAARGTRLFFTLSLSAAPSSTGSALTIGSTVRQSTNAGTASVNRSLGTTGHADDGCASTGEIEKRLAAVLTAP